MCSLNIRFGYLYTRVVEREFACSHKLPHSTMLTDPKVQLFGSLLLCSFILYRIQRVKQVWQAFENLPARPTPYSYLHSTSSVAVHVFHGSQMEGTLVGRRCMNVSLSPFTAFLSTSRFMSRRLRSFQLRYCSTLVAVSVQYPTAGTRRCYSGQGGTSLQVSAVASRSIYPCSQSFRETWHCLSFI